jgi:quercetin dioxygenase-like cupin family protein
MLIRSLVTTCIVLSLLVAGLAAEDQPKVVNPAEMKFEGVPNIPACAQSALQSGDPSKGASVMYIKLSPGCTVPLHWHTPNEQILMVSGTGKVAPHPGKPQTLQRGAYAFMPSKHHHAFTCAAACTFYLTSDGAFDIHYVDPSGKEISPEEALKKGKKAAKK